MTIGPSRKRQRDHSCIDLCQPLCYEKVFQPGSHPKILSISKATQVLRAPLSQCIPFRDGAIVRLDIEIYLNQLHPTSGPQNSVDRVSRGVNEAPWFPSRCSPSNTRPFDVSNIRRPSGSIDAGCDKSGVDKVEMVRGEGERLVQIVNLGDIHHVSAFKNLNTRHRLPIMRCCCGISLCFDKQILRKGGRGNSMT